MALAAALAGCAPSSHRISNNDLGVSLSVPTDFVAAAVTERTIKSDTVAIGIEEVRIQGPSSSSILILHSRDPRFPDAVLRYAAHQDIHLGDQPFTQYALQGDCRSTGYVTKKNDHYYALQFSCMNDDDSGKIMRSLALTEPIAPLAPGLRAHELESTQMPVALVVPGGFATANDTAAKEGSQWRIARGEEAVAITASRTGATDWSRTYATKRDRTFGTSTFTQWLDGKDPTQPTVFTAEHRGIRYDIVFHRFTSEKDIDAIMESVRFTDDDIQ